LINFGSGAGHGDAIIGSDGDLKIPADQANGDLLPCGDSAGFDRRSYRGTSARAASVSLAAAALPHAHPQGALVQNFHKLGVDALGEDGKIFKRGTDLLKVHPLHALSKYDGVRIAHADRGQTIMLAENDDGFLHHLRPVKQYGDFVRIKHRPAHIHRHADDGAVFKKQAKRLDAGQRFDGDDILFDQAVIGNILCHATDGVAAHFALAAIQIEHTHFRIRNGAGQNQDHAVASDGKVAGRHLPREVRGVKVERRVEQVDINIIVACAVHFGKSDLTHYTPPQGTAYRTDPPVF